MTAQNPGLEGHLKQLHLTAILERYAEEAQVASQQRWSYERYLAALVEEEVARRSRNRRQRAGNCTRQKTQSQQVNQ